MRSVEKNGRTVDEAIVAALEELGLHRDEVEVDILQIESSGVLGLFGRKEGRVRVTPIKKGKAEKGAQPSRTEAREKPRGEKRDRPRPEKREPARAKEQTPPPRRESQPKKESQPKREPQPRRESAPKRERQPEPEPRRERVERPEVEREFARKEPIPDGELGPFACDVVKKVAECFGIAVEVEGRESERAVNLRVMGEGVGQLIGRRGKTLGAVQYMVSRLINEDREERKKITIDVDGYNEDREEALRELAERTAERVLHNRKPASLRPMSPPERRVIHLTLQDHLEVATESFGDEGRRQVVVYPRALEPAEVERFIKNEMRGGGRRGGREGGRSGGRGRSRNGGYKNGNRR